MTGLRRFHAPRTTLARAVFVLFGAINAASVVAQSPQAPALVQQSEVAEHGFTIRYPAGWSVETDANVVRLVNLPADRAKAVEARAVDAAGQILVTVERRRDHADALRRLEDVQAEFASRGTFLTIGGWPAFERQALDRREQPGDGDGEKTAEQQPTPGVAQEPKLPPAKPLLTPLQILRMTTAVAAGNLLVRVEARLPGDAPPALRAAATAVGRGLVFRTQGNPVESNREIGVLRARPLRRPMGAVRSGPAAAPRAAGAGASAGGSGGALPLAPMSLQNAGLAQRVITGGVASESEIAVSTNGQNIVIAQQFVYATSNDGGVTFPFTGNFPSSSNGDPSLAFGRSGAFYEATINGSSTAFNVSTDNGRTFTFRANAFTCPTTGANQCAAGFPDQEHIAADRANAGAGGGDQVYSAWRHLNGNWGIVCSQDGGQNWTGAVYTAGDVPRITVGPDGAVFVIYQNGNNVMLHRFASCTNGLTAQAGFPVTVATVGPNWVQCPVPGLDRCNNGNNLSSFTVAVDDTNANHVYVAYAQNTSAVNENVIVRDSTDGGATWPAARTVAVNSGANARRFMPWLCSVGGTAYVSWFDRRAATAANNSLTDYFGASVRVNSTNALVAGPERRINPPGTADAQCAAGMAAGSAASWPGSARATADADNCVPQPQLAGRCRNPGGGGSQTACDFSAGGCPTGESCVIWGGGIPKYGDYTGNACAAGRFYTAWPSAMTPPPAIGLAGRIDMYFASLVVAASQVQIPGPVSFADTCVGTVSTAVANVCNTGTNDLHVDPITSSDPQFSVFAPSSGYPVTIAPGSCFPFQVRFVPTSAGNKTATLTVPSDDTVVPSATIAVSGRATQAGITTAIADTGGFGTVAEGLFRDQPLTIANPGACVLTVSGITSSAADFQMAQVVAFPITVAPGTSTDLPIRFQPTSFGAKSATLTLTSNAAGSPTRVIAVTGNGGVPVIATSVVDTGSFGPVCVGTTRDLSVTVTNGGTSPLRVSGVTSSSAEFETPTVASFPLVVAAGTSLDLPIRFAPVTSGSKTVTVSIASNDPAAPSKVVTLTAETPDAELCNPPSFTAAGVTLGPTFGSSATGNWTVAAQGRHLQPFGERHSFGLQAQGEFHYYRGRHEGQLDAGVMNRWQFVQFGVFGSVKFAELDVLKDGGTLGQASAVVDLLLPTAAPVVRVSIFGSKGFKDIGLLTSDPSFTLPTPISGGSVAVGSRLENVVRAVDTLGVGALVGVAPNWDLDGHVMWLRRQSPTPLGNGVGAMGRVTFYPSSVVALYGEVTLNETYVGPTNSGRVVVGLVFGRWTRTRDFSNKHTPLATEVPRVHFDRQTRVR